MIPHNLFSFMTATGHFLRYIRVGNAFTFVEDRLITIGRNAYTDILYMCYTMQKCGITRLISVRMAERPERRVYEQNLRL